MRTGLLATLCMVLMCYAATSRTYGAPWVLERWNDESQKRLLKPEKDTVGVFDNITGQRINEIVEAANLDRPIEYDAEYNACVKDRWEKPVTEIKKKFAWFESISEKMIREVSVPQNAPAASSDVSLRFQLLLRKLVQITSSRATVLARTHRMDDAIKLCIWNLAVSRFVEENEVLIGFVGRTNWDHEYIFPDIIAISSLIDDPPKLLPLRDAIKSMNYLDSYSRALLREGSLQLDMYRAGRLPQYFTEASGIPLKDYNEGSLNEDLSIALSTILDLEDEYRANGFGVFLATHPYPKWAIVSRELIEGAHSLAYQARNSEALRVLAVSVIEVECWRYDHGRYPTANEYKIDIPRQDKDFLIGTYRGDRTGANWDVSIAGDRDNRHAAKLSRLVPTARQGDSIGK